MASPLGSGTTLIIPAYNEAEVIGVMLDAVPRDWFATILVADNGSTDQTAMLARRHGATVIAAPERGYGAACLAALQHVPAESEVVVFMQADLQEDPREAVRLVEPILRQEADLVIGSRVLGEAERGSLTAPQRFGNWLATRLLALRFGMQYTDLGPYRAIRAEVLRELQMEDRNFGWTVEMQMKALRKGYRVLEVPVSYRVRRAGVNKVTGTLGSSIRAGRVILSTIARYW